MGDIKEIGKAPNETVIKLLEDLLHRANSGDLQAIAIAGTTGDGSVLNCFSAEYYTMSLLGELRLLERDLIDLCCETRRQVAWEFVE